MYKGNSFWHMEAYAPAIGKVILKCQKNLSKIFVCTYRHFTRAHQVSWKTDIFCDLYKKKRKGRLKSLFYFQILSFLHATQNMLVFSVTTLWAHRTSRLMVEIFCSNYLTLQNTFWKQFKNWDPSFCDDKWYIS